MKGSAFMTQEAYRNRVKAAAPKSPMGKNIVMAFLFVLDVKIPKLDVGKLLFGNK